MRLLERLRSERGMALVVALGTMAALTIGSTTVIALGSASATTASLGSARQSAQALAEAGVEYAAAKLHATPQDRWYDANALPQQTVEIDGHPVAYSGTLSGNVWTLRGTATVASPTGGSPATRTVARDVAITTTVTRSAANDAIWGYLYHDNPATCMRIANNAVLDASLYVRGDLCLAEQAKIAGASVQVEGRILLGSGAKIGETGRAISKARVAGGCGTSESPRACEEPDNVYAVSTGLATDRLVKPPLDLAGWYANAAPGPRAGCTAGTFPGGFDSDAVLDGGHPATNLTPAYGYSCIVADASGARIGELTWRPGSPGTLAIHGTVFFDGPVRLEENAYAVYEGQGTIYANGPVVAENNVRLCGVAACDAGWQASANRLAIVATGAIALSNNVVFQGAAYAGGAFTELNNVAVWGPVVADTLELANNAGNHHPVTWGPVLPGMPGVAESVTTLVTVPGTYRRE